MGRLAKQFTTRISLEAAGDASNDSNKTLWKDAYINVTRLSAKALPELGRLNIDRETTEMSEEQMSGVLPIIKKAFVDGKVVLEGELVDAEPDDLDDLPLDATNALIAAVMGQPDPKS